MWQQGGGGALPPYVALVPSGNVMLTVLLSLLVPSLSSEEQGQSQHL